MYPQAKDVWITLLQQSPDSLDLEDLEPEDVARIEKRVTLIEDAGPGRKTEYILDGKIVRTELYVKGDYLKNPKVVGKKEAKEIRKKNLLPGEVLLERKQDDIEKLEKIIDCITSRIADAKDPREKFYLQVELNKKAGELHKLKSKNERLMKGTFADAMAKKFPETRGGRKRLRTCGGCKKVFSKPIMSCPCGKAFYCNKKCQRKDWKAGHKLLHKASKQTCI